jgi:hypothetical protein
MQHGPSDAKLLAAFIVPMRMAQGRTPNGTPSPGPAQYASRPIEIPLALSVRTWSTSLRTFNFLLDSHLFIDACLFVWIDLRLPTSEYFSSRTFCGPGASGGRSSAFELFISEGLLRRVDFSRP